MLSFRILVRLFPVRGLLVVALEQVVVEVVREITPDGVDVVRVVLCVFVFEKEARALHAIVEAFSQMGNFVLVPL